MTPFRDEYTNFTFNGTTSEQMKVWITNSRDIQFRLTPEFTDTFVSPAFSNSQVLTGTNITKSTFSLKCIAIDVTMHEWRAIQQWLSPYAVGRLEFDFNLDTYYNAKISKSITGTTFVRGAANHVLGDVYIVEFSIEFTTVDDFAALGVVNVGVIGKSFGLTIDYLNTSDNSDDDYNYTIETVSNNKFFMPMVVNMKKDNISKPEDVEDITNISNKTVKLKWNGNTGDISDIAYIITPNGFKNNGYYFAEYNIAIKDKKIMLYKSSDGNSRELPLQALADLSQHSSVTGTMFNLKLFGDNLFLVIKNTTNLKLESILNNTTSHAICNTGSYELYPTILAKKIDSSKYITIKKEGEDFYKYFCNLDMSIPYLTFDGQHGLALSGDTLAEQAYVYKTMNETEIKEKMFGTTSTNLGVLSIPSGRPELLKCKFTSDLQIMDIGSSTSSLKIGLKYITFKTSTPLQYNHTRSIIHLFHEVAANTPYNAAGYPYFPIPVDNNKLYISKFYDSHLLRESFIIPISDDEYALIGPYYDLKHLHKDSIMYLSICDYTLLDIEAEGFIYLQSRDAF